MRVARQGLGSYLLRAAAVNWVASALTILYALFITPIVIRALNTDLYGVWSFLNGLLAYSSLFYVGLGAAFIKYLSQYRALGDRAAIDRLASVVLVLYTGIGLLCLVLFIVIAPYVPSMLAQPLSASDSRETVIACMLLGARLLFMFVATVFSGVLIAEERITTVSSVTIAAILARSIVVPLTLRYPSPLITLALIISASSGFEAIALVIAAKRSVPQLRVRPVRPRRQELGLLYGFGIRAFFIDLAAWLINYTDNVVIGVIIGADGVALYSLPLQLVTYGRVVVQGLISALLPRLSAYAAEGDRASLASAYLRVTRLTNYIAALIALELLTRGIPFLRLWVGNRFADGVFPILACLSVAGFCQALSTQAAVPFFQATHSLRTPVRLLLLEAFLNLGLSIFLAKHYGITGVAIATLLPTLLTTIVLPVALCRQLGVRFASLVAGSVFPGVALLATGLIFNVGLDRILQCASYPCLALRSALDGGLAVGVGMLVLPQEDRTAIRRLLKR
jgi:O-antigen/teichoic acid export membrane protein